MQGDGEGAEEVDPFDVREYSKWEGEDQDVGSFFDRMRWDWDGIDCFVNPPVG